MGARALSENYHSKEGTRMSPLQRRETDQKVGGSMGRGGWGTDEEVVGSKLLREQRAAIIKVSAKQIEEKKKCVEVLEG